MEKVNLSHKFTLFNDLWSPKIVGELNGQYVKLAKLRGEFLWHHHEAEDEMFLVVEGTLIIQVRDQDDIILERGEFVIIPRGVEHKPVAAEEVHVLLFEPQSTQHTGNVKTERTVEKQDWI
jgi:mannose-6-phosphate isomerase-like protein (cupin superfamily)